MKKIILVGDSIRMGYEPVVKKKLDGRCEVWGPVENGGTSDNVIKNLDGWCIGRRADVIHVNCGLHDLKRADDFSKNTTPLDEYERNVRRILERLKKETGARIIWAATTPVIDEWHLRVKKFARRQEDVLAYNAAAAAVAASLGVEIDDLHSVIWTAGPEKCLQPDGVHMNPTGNELLAAAVAARVEAEIGRAHV